MSGSGSAVAIAIGIVTGQWPLPSSSRTNKSLLGKVLYTKNYENIQIESINYFGVSVNIATGAAMPHGVC